MTLADRAPMPDDLPGLTGSSGSLTVGDRLVGVEGVSPEVARRILGSARPVGVPAPGVATWRTVDVGAGVTAVVPEDHRVHVMLRNGVPKCASERSPAQPTDDGRWVTGLCRNRIVTVTAPTQALADLVASQVEGY